MKNIEIARIFFEIAEMLEMLGEKFKPQAYQKAARSIEALSDDIEEVYKRGKLEDIPGVGESIAEKIEELLKTGRLKYYTDLKKKMPMNVEELMQVQGLGPKRIMTLYKKLGIRNMNDLKNAAGGHKIQNLEGFGEKVEQDILKGIEFAKKKTGRFILGYIMPAAEKIKENIEKLKSVKRIEIAGSYRRRKETIGDIDLLVTSRDPEEVMNYFVKMPDVEDVLAKGVTRSAVRLRSGLSVDVRVLKEREYGSALFYFTGNKQHNIEIRKIALKKGYTLSEYGLFKLKGKELVAGKTEEEIYKKLGLRYIEPEMRENTGEIEAALKGKLPKLITEKDILGDLQMHSNWSDGSGKIEDMADTAEKNGLKFIAITDHVGQLAIANALSERRLERQMKIIDKINKKSGIRILKGAEVDILKNGRLALSRRLQNELDIVLGSIHLGFKMPEKEMTKRIASALENERIHIFAHPTGRILNEREPYNINMETLFETAKRTNTFLEINCHPERMDLSGESIKSGKEAGCRFSIGTDSHSRDNLKYIRLGAFLARRGWLEAKDVLNCNPINKVEKILGSK